MSSPSNTSRSPWATFAQGSAETAPGRLPSIGGVRVLVPRASPTHPICQALERRGAVPVPIGLTTLEPADPAVIGHALAVLATSAWALFLTERAVRVLADDGRPLTPLIGVSRLTSGLGVAAASPAIARELAALDVPVDLTPLRGEGAVPLALSLPRGPLAPERVPEQPAQPEAPPLPDLAVLRELVQHAGAVDAANAATALLGGADPADNAGPVPNRPWDVAPRDKRAVLLGSNAVDPRAVALVAALGWEPEPITLHTTQAAPVDRATVAKALAYGAGGRPRWPGILLLTSPATVKAVIASIGTPPAEVAVAAADEPTARTALAAGLRVDAIAAQTTHEAFAAACEGAWHRAWQAGVLR